MKALEMNNLLHSKRNDPNFVKDLNLRLANVRAVTDSSTPRVLKELKDKIEHNQKSPTKFNSKEHDRIAHENLKLAKRIFQIMESHPKTHPSSNADQSHPGTLNYQSRLKEAKRIHHDNMNLASKLESIKASKMLGNTQKRPSKSRGGNKSATGSPGISPRSNPEQQTEMDGGYLQDRAWGGAVDGSSNNNDRLGSSSASNSPRQGVTYADSTKGEGSNQINRPAPPNTPQSRGKSRGAVGGMSRPTSKQQQKVLDNYVLLESRKIQGGKQIDVAVIKEPFKDKYAVFGIDIESGQRYELRLTSDEISGIVDGDRIVTSMEDIEVWKILLNKINLVAVESFSKIPSESQPLQEQTSQNVMAQTSDRAPSSNGRKPVTGTPVASAHRNVSNSQNNNNNSSSSDVGSHTKAGKVPNAPSAPKNVRPGGRAANNVKASNNNSSSSSNSNSEKEKSNGANKEISAANVQDEGDKTQALVKLQARFRGFKVRKEVQTDNLINPIPSPSLVSQAAVKDDEKLIKLQATIRGYSVRKSKGSSNNKPIEGSRHQQENAKNNLSMITQPGDEQRAAVVLQAKFRGFKVRKNSVAGK